MTVLMPHSCWRAMRPHPSRRAREVGGSDTAETRARRGPTGCAGSRSNSTAARTEESSAAAVGVGPCSFVRTADASAVRPDAASQRGDSGRKKNPMPMTALGTVANPSMYLHPPSLPVSSPATIPAVTWPTVIIAETPVTSRPRTALGAHSATYIGAVREERPTPAPTTVLPATSHPKEGATPMLTAPTKKMAAAVSTTGLLPYVLLA
mmetsp:Transcript_40924/g.80074  ORF Transcript_40924/g.80074 Transcript_40924/m.80074 type:complete len:208 (-) Transcript_40924:650-1273(-)